MKLTIHGKAKHSNNMESGTRSRNDVAVRFLLRQLNRLLLFQYQEAVELCRGLFAVCVPAQLKQTDGFRSGFGKSSLENTRKKGA